MAAPAVTQSKSAKAVARSARGDSKHSLFCRGFGAALLVLTALLTARYPIGAIALAFGLGVYALTLYRLPSLWLVVVPAALPLFDFADRTGWSLFDEFDLLLLVTLAVLLLRTGWPGWSGRHSRGFALLLALFGASLGISFARGLLPWEPWGPNAMLSYLSHYHAIRVGKGLLFGLLLWPWARTMLAPASRGRDFLAGGVLAGLVLTCLAMVLERWAFVGLLDFNSGYRATAFFTSVNNGGGSIDGYLLLALPFVAACWLVWRNWVMRGAGVVLLAVALYCVLVTFTRIDYLAVAIFGAILLAALARASLALPVFLAITVPIAFIGAVLGVMAFGGAFTQHRFASTATDMQFRVNEWQRDLALSEPGIGTLLFGNGLGSFPRRQYLHAPAGASPAAYAIAADDDNRYLRLGYGTPVFIVQRLARPLPDKVTVTARVRGAVTGVGLGINICEKSLLYSFRCESQVRMLDPVSDDGWQGWSTELDLRELRHPPQPVYFSLYHVGESDALVDADAVSVQDATGRELLANGDFSAGAARWFFISDDHQNWRIDNLWLHVWFEQGLFGVLALAALLFAGLGAAIRGFRERQPFAVIALASLTAFATVALTESLIENARIGLLLLLALYLTPSWRTAVSKATGSAPQAGATPATPAAAPTPAPAPASPARSPA